MLSESSKVTEEKLVAELVLGGDGRCFRPFSHSLYINSSSTPFQPTGSFLPSEAASS